MKVAKLVIGILSIVLSLVIMLQSCAVGISNALAEEGGTSGSTGFFVALLFIVAGIIGIAARSSKGGAIATTIFYVLAGIFAFSNVGTYSDLIVWGVLALIFALVFFISIFTQNYPKKTKSIQE